MPSPPLMLLCAAGVGLAALLYYYFSAREERGGFAMSHGSTGGRSRQRQRNRSDSRYELEECSICQDIVINPTSLRTLTCGHHFHVQCINKWFEACPHPTTCPNCREPVR